MPSASYSPEAFGNWYATGDGSHNPTGGWTQQAGNQPNVGYQFFKTTETIYRGYWDFNPTGLGGTIVTAATIALSAPGGGSSPVFVLTAFGPTSLGANLGESGVALAIAVATAQAWANDPTTCYGFAQVEDAQASSTVATTGTLLITYTTNSPPSAPGAVTNPVAGQKIANGSNLHVTWGASVDPDGDPITYYVEYWDNAAWQVLGNTVNTYYDINPVNVPAGNFYKIRVRAIDATGSNTYSAWTESGVFEVYAVVNVVDNTTVYFDGVATILVTVDTTDNIAVGADDSAASDRQITSFVNVVDDIAVAATEAPSNIVNSVNVVDDLIVATDDGTAGTSFVVLSVVDDIAVAAADAMSTTAVTVNTVDATAVAADDSTAAGVLANLDRVDTIQVATDDASVQPMPVMLDRVDSIDIFVDEVTDNFIGVARTDSLDLAANDVSDLMVPIIADDTFVISVDEAFPLSLEGFDRVDVTLVQLADESSLYRIYESGPPPDEILYAATAPFTRIVRQVDIYESDGTTPFMLKAPFLGGNVNCDMTRSERRTFDLQLQNIDGALTIYPEGFWYDKVIKIYRGIQTADTEYYRQLGEFLIDGASEPNFPATLSLTGRDYTKKLLTSKFPAATAFAKNQPIENLIHTIAVNAGIMKFDLPLTGKNTGRDFFYDRGVERWKAIEEIAHAYNYDVYFTHDGYLTMTEYADPTLGQPDYTFQTGRDFGNLSAYEKRTADARMYNHVVVSGESSDTIPVWAEVKNEIPGHPTSVARIGERTYFFTSAFITTYEQALDVATSFLKVHALEQFEASLDSVVIPWLEVGTVVDFIDPNPADGDPTRYLFSDCTIPLALSTMKSGLKRVTVVI